MLKLSLTDALNQISFFEQHIGGLKHNLAVLRKKLPDMKDYQRKSQSQIQRELEAEKGETTIIDIPKKDKDED